MKLTNTWHNLKYGIVDTIRRRIARAKVTLRPARCRDCGVRIAPTYVPEYRTVSEDPRHAHVRAAVACYEKSLCRGCLAKRVSALFESLTKYEHRDIAVETGYTLNQCCDSCSNVRPTIKIGTLNGPVSCDIRISVEWWNGFHVCEDCITTVVKYGKLSTGVYGTRRAIFSNKLISYVVCHNDVHQQIYLDPADRLLQPLKD